MYSQHEKQCLKKRRELGGGREDLKRTPSEVTSWTENVENVQIFPIAGLRWWFYQYLCSRSSLWPLPILSPLCAAMFVRSLSVKSKKGFA